MTPVRSKTNDNIAIKAIKVIILFFLMKSIIYIQYLLI